MELIQSLNSPLAVKAFDFSLADGAGHKIAWLRLGANFRQFVTNNVEAELYEQTPGAQLLSIRCKQAPSLLTTTKQIGADDDLIVTGLDITFPLALRIRMTDET